MPRPPPPTRRFAAVSRKFLRTDDCPALVPGISRSGSIAGHWRPGVSTDVTVTYVSGERIPYRVRLWTPRNPDGGVGYIGGGHLDGNG